MNATNPVTIKRLPGPGKTTWNVDLDGLRKRGIENEETVTVDVEHGQHVLQITADLIRSNKLLLDVQGKGEITLECGYKKNTLVLLIVGLLVIYFGVLIFLALPANVAFKPYSLVIQGLCWAIYIAIISRPGMLLYIKPVKA